MNPLDESLERILAHEGGWSDHPADRGGRTMYGITAGTFATAKRDGVVPGLPTDVSGLTKPQARLIYERMFWEPSGAHLVPWPLSYAQMDAAVQHGPGRAVKWLQKATGDLKPDGVLGPITQRRIEGSTDWLLVMARVLAHRGELYIRILRTPSQTAFAAGWANRYRDVSRLCLYDHAPVELVRIPVTATRLYTEKLRRAPMDRVGPLGRLWR